MLEEAQMDISLEDARPLIIGAFITVLLVGLALLGHGVSPVEAGRPQLLTPERWLAAALTRQAAGEIAHLVNDVRSVREVLAKEPPDAIHAMTLAQRVYAAHRTGTAATAPARQALIAAGGGARCAARRERRHHGASATLNASRRWRPRITLRGSCYPAGRSSTSRSRLWPQSPARLAPSPGLGVEAG